MRVKKEIILVSSVIILFALLLFLPNIIDLIPSKEVKFEIAVIISLLVFLLLIYVTYSDIRKSGFTTTVYIVLLDIIVIIVLVVLTYNYIYTYIHKSNEINIEILLRNINIRTVSLLVFLCSSILKNFLESKRFKKK